MRAVETPAAFTKRRIDSKPGSARGGTALEALLATMRCASGLAINRLADRVQRRIDVVQRLSMTNAEIAARRENFGEASHQALARRLIEIDHHIATEDHVERAVHRPGLQQIQHTERHDGTQLS